MVKKEFYLLPLKTFPVSPAHPVILSTPNTAKRNAARGAASPEARWTISKSNQALFPKSRNKSSNFIIDTIHYCSVFYIFFCPNRIDPSAPTELTRNNYYFCAGPCVQPILFIECSITEHCRAATVQAAPSVHITVERTISVFRPRSASHGVSASLSKKVPASGWRRNCGHHSIELTI